ncbi:MAG: heme exporter protein D [Halioglobus sp.]|jgi:heme exporter protein D
MYFESVEALINMDGHGIYVWPAYIITIGVVIAILIAPIRRRRQILSQLASELKRQQGSPKPLEEDG